MKLYIDAYGIMGSKKAVVVRGELHPDNGETAQELHDKLAEIAKKGPVGIDFLPGLEAITLRALREELERVEAERDDLVTQLTLKDLRIRRLEKLLPDFHDQD